MRGPCSPFLRLLTHVPPAADVSVPRVQLLLFDFEVASTPARERERRAVLVVPSIFFGGRRVVRLGRISAAGCGSSLLRWWLAICGLVGECAASCSTHSMSSMSISSWLLLAVLATMAQSRSLASYARRVSSALSVDQAA